MKKTIINSIALYGSFFILILLGLAALKSLFEPAQVLTNVERITQIRDDSITYWKDQYNREHAEKLMAQGQYAELRVVYGPFMDSILVSLNIQKDAIKSIAAVGLKNSGELTARIDTQYVDSSAYYSFKYKDRWLDMDGTLSDMARIKYTSRDSLIVTGYTKKTGFLGLGKKETYIDAYSLNPNSKITGLTGMMVLKERQKRFGLGPFVGIGWSGNGIVPTVGVGLNYSLIKF